LPTFVLHTKTPLPVNTERCSTNDAILAVTASSSSCRRLAEHPTPVLWPVWAVLPRRFRSSALTRLRVGLPPDNRARSA
jgi:hypothetical protein